MKISSIKAKSKQPAGKLTADRKSPVGSRGLKGHRPGRL